VDIQLIDRTAAEGQFADEAMEPISSKTAVSPSISIVERLIMMTVEKALPDCGRRRNLVTDGSAHASAPKRIGHFW
jgi:hypothetical protein